MAVERGVIVLNNAVGRALRKKPVAVRAGDVLDCTGGFFADDIVQLSFRGIDGGQFAVARGVVRCDETALRSMLGDATRDAEILIDEADVALLWPPTRSE